ncbi:MAG TPA: thiamine ABC transporter substrate-binding protein [Candidatus Norongarragalinales archaeon]|nr:thiamine ABC transporter substrate-binding protein [Candidatus Norongarragalinales archaeon]
MQEKIGIILVLLAIFGGALLVTNLSAPPNGNTAEILRIDGNDPPAVPAIGPSGELVIYTYDGITSEWGLGPKIFPKFEEKCRCKLKVVAKGDVGAFVSQLIFEKESPKADIALGIDNTFMEKVKQEDLLEPYAPKNLEHIDRTLVPWGAGKPDYRFIPFDWGYLAFVYDSKLIERPPASLEELTLPLYRKKIAIEDARTSSPGKVFLHWIAGEYGDRTRDYLERLSPNLLIITPGWTEAYNLFLQGEVPIVLSYSTSPAYHIVNENTTRFKAAPIQTLPRQTEFVSIVKGARNRLLAEQFVEFILSREAQEEIPLGNFMYPSRNDVPLPDAFNLSFAPSAAPLAFGDDEKWLKIWEDAFSD